jgi:hypothetical protein
MGNSALVGAEVGTTIMPGYGTVTGAVVGGLVSIFTDADAKQQSSHVGGRTINARQIWEQVHPGSSSSLHGGADAAVALQSVHHQRSQQIDAINKVMDAAWQGNASQQVQAGAHPLGIWLQDSASNLGKSKTYLTNQGEAFDQVHSQVQEIAAKPPHQGFLDHMNPFSDKDQEIKNYNEQGQTNVQAFNAYYQASAQNAAGMPQYKAWDGNNFSGGKKPGDGGGGGNTPPGGGGGIPAGGGGIPGGGRLPGEGGNLPGGGSNLPGDGGMYKPNPPTYGDYQTPKWDGTTAAGYTPSASSTGVGGAGGFGPTGSGAGAGGFGGGGGIGAGGFGPGGSGSLGAGASSGAAASMGSSALRGGAAAGAAGAAGGRGTTGANGTGGQGGRGKGSEDEEHQTKYLVGEDPNELFGTDELTAPPVIGE